ncbi:MAG: hypothetical protein KJS92_08850, partial [Bacteroidetes bacterium]|nr:hypothetical protein [Bacteroidota bacterium]
MRPLKRLLAFFALVSGLGLNGQMIKNPDFSCRPGKTTVKTGETIEIILTTSNIPATWHLFSEETDCPPEEGPVEASLEFTPHPGYQLVGKLSSIGDHLVRDDIFGCSTGQFEGKAEFRQKIKILSPDAVIKFRFLGQMCTDVTGMCVTVKSPLMEVKDLKITGAAQETPVVETPAPTAPAVDTTKHAPLPAPTEAALTPAGKPGYQASGPNEAGTCKP